MAASAVASSTIHSHVHIHTHTFRLEGDREKNDGGFVKLQIEAMNANRIKEKIEEIVQFPMHIWGE